MRQATIKILKKTLSPSRILVSFFCLKKGEIMKIATSQNVDKDLLDIQTFTANKTLTYPLTGETDIPDLVILGNVDASTDATVTITKSGGKILSFSLYANSTYELDMADVKEIAVTTTVKCIALVYQKIVGQYARS